MAGLMSAVGEMAEMVATMFKRTRAALLRVADPIIRDGTVPAFFRQGADEIGMALKAFPESVHAEEPGTVLNPTQYEITARRFSPGSVYGHAPAQQESRLPSPSEIAKNKQPRVAEQDRDRQRQHGRDGL